MFLGKENKVAKIKCNNQSKRDWLRNYIYKKIILAFQYIYNTQFNLWKTHFGVTGIKSGSKFVPILSKIGF